MKPVFTKFKITTLGCKVNQFESEAIARQLTQSDLTQVPKNVPADLCIINTCTVTGKASMQSRQAVRQAIRANPRASIVVTGCYAQTAPDEIKEIEGVHAIVGHGEKHKIPEMILKTDCESCTAEIPVRQNRRFEKAPAIGFGNRARPFLKIQDGCDAFCTYCIVPRARGPSRSLPVDEVLEGIRELKKAGYHEVVLTGIHMGCYGQDLTPRTDLLTLLGQIRDTGAIDRVRLSSIEPRELSEKLIDFVAGTGEGAGRICPHFHIPLQSGDDSILKKMHRPYSRYFFKELVLKIHERIPDAAIGVDVLVGFPGESEAAFEHTHSLIAELPVTYLHVFPFSARKGTPAYSFSDTVVPEVVRERAHRMRELGNIKKSACYNKFTNERLELIVEGTADISTGNLKGTSSNYIPVFFQGGQKLINTLIEVQVENVDNNLNVFGGLHGNSKK